MIWQLDLLLFLLAIGASVIALAVRDLLSAVAALAAFSLAATLLYAEMGAVDVALTEAALGAGVTTVLFVAALFLTRRRSVD